MQMAVIDAFARFALPILWDFAEAIPVNDNAGGYSLCYERICIALDGLIFNNASRPNINRVSATIPCNKK